MELFCLLKWSSFLILDMSFQIKKSWNNETIKDHKPIKISLSWIPNTDFITIQIDAPFFNDPAPEIPPNNSLPKLWNYEGNP